MSTPLSQKKAALPSPPAQRLAGGRLSIVATPIGNLRDITLRALDTLKEADVICCEDTRHTSILLQAHQIKTQTVSYHEHNAERQRPVLLEWLAAGKHIALISDAGTPLISDPGYRFVREARALGVTVTPIPGVSALITALCAAGLPTDQFHFCGFLPAKASARKHKLEALTATAGTLVFYESPRRLAAFLADAATILGAEREAVIARELTKKFEEFRSDSLAQLATHYAAADTPKGEVVVLIAPQDTPVTLPETADVEAMLRDALQNHSLKDAAELVALALKLPKREIYQQALTLQKKNS
jgi:16S rRNA (cytidine1402-2'-O)-methyltransferase